MIAGRRHGNYTVRAAVRNAKVSSCARFLIATWFGRAAAGFDAAQHGIPPTSLETFIPYAEKLTAALLRRIETATRYATGPDTPAPADVPALATGPGPFRNSPLEAV